MATNAASRSEYRQLHLGSPVSAGPMCFAAASPMVISACHRQQLIVIVDDNHWC
jgi:hypothetical protein